MSRAIGVFSGKGGVGKTTLVANLGASLTSDFHKNVLIFDSNLHSSHLGLHFGLYEEPPVTLRDILKKNVPIMQAIYIHPPTGVRIVPAPLNDDGIDLTKARCCNLVDQTKRICDIVILDCAPGLGKEVIVPMQAIDEAIVVTTPDIASATDAMKTIELLKKFKKKVLGLVINRYQNKKYELTQQEISSTTNYNILETVPEDTKIPDSISKGLPAVISFPHSRASVAFKQLTASLINEPYRKEKILERLTSIFKLPIFSKKGSSVESMRKEVSDVIELRDGLVQDVREELKQEILKKVRERLRGRYGK